MATIGDLLVSLRGDSTEWNNSLNTAGKALQQLVTKAEKAGQDLSKFNSQNINLLAGWKNEIGKTYSTFTDALVPVKQGLVDQGKALSTTSKGINTLALETVVAAKTQQTFDAQLKTLSNSLWLATAGLKQFGMAMSTAFTVPIVAAGTAAVKTFTDFEKGTLKIQTAAEISSETANKITDGFVKISQQVPLTVTELQKAGFAAAQAGVTGEEGITNFAEAAVKLSKVGGDAFKDLAIEDLSNNLAKISTAFGEAGENMENVTNISSMLLAVSKAVPGGLGEVIEALRRASPQAAILGLNLSDVTAVMGTLVAAALPAARAGTEFNTALSNMVSNMDVVAEWLGVTDDGLKKFKDRMDTDLIGVLDEVIQRFNRYESVTDKANKITEVFGETGKKSIEALINNYDLFKDLQARANQELESGTLLAAEFGIQANSLSGTFTVFKSAVQSVAYAIGKDLAPYISYFAKNATQAMINLANAWKSLNPTIKAAIVVFAGLIAVIGPLALLLNTLFLSPIAGLITFIKWIGKAIGSLIGLTAVGETATITQIKLAFALEGAAGGFAMLGTAVWAALAPLLTIVGVIAAVIGGLYLLGKALGVGFKLKLPSMPNITMPTFGDTTNADTTAEADQKALEESNKKKKEAAQKEQTALEKELRDKKKADDKLLKAKEDEVEAYEKIRDAEIKAQQKLVDDQEDIIDAKKEAWEDEKRLAQEQINAQEAVIKTIKKTLTAAKKQLSALEDAEKSEVDTAEGRVEIAENSLDAAQEALKREKILGNDEYDLSYREAEARVKAAEETLQLAKNNVVAIKQAYQKQIEAQEAVVTATQDQVDVQEDALDDLKTALEKRTAIVDKEVDLLDDELKIRQDNLDAVKESTQEKLDLLKEEKDNMKDQLDEEEQLIQDRLDAMKDQVDAINNLPTPELPDLAGNFGLLNDEITKQIQDMQKQIGDSMSFGIETNIKEGGAFDKIRKAFQEAKTNALESGKSNGIAFVEGILAGWFQASALWYEFKENVNKAINDAIIELGKKIFVWLFDALFGKGVWEELDKQAKEKGQNVPQMIWEGFKTSWSQKVAEPFKQWLQDKIVIPLQNLGSSLSSAARGLVDKIKEGFENNMGKIGNVAQNIKNALFNGLNSLGSNIWQWGRDMMGNFAQGIWDGIGWVKDAVNSAVNWIKGILHFSEPDFGPLKEMSTWGKDLVR
ncbi:MAG: phage tail tape measure protein, partial [Candidatus Paceibacterota bacterium]